MDGRTEKAGWEIDGEGVMRVSKVIYYVCFYGWKMKLVVIQMAKVEVGDDINQVFLRRKR